MGVSVPQGVLIFQGMTVGVQPGDLVISLDPAGGAEAKAILSTAYNVVPVWLRIAHDNVKQAKAASKRIAEEWSADDARNRELLITELECCLQVFVACGVALDALYDQLRPFAGITDAEINAWRKNRTSHATQVAEVIRRVFKLQVPASGQFKQALSEILKYRDMAVHPSLALKQSCSRPDIPVGVDWKFAAYRFDNSHACFTSTIGMISYLFEHPCAQEAVTASIQNIVLTLQELGVVTVKK